MKLTLTTPEMLDLWRLHSAFQPPLADAVFRRHDGIDSDGLFTAEMNRWYRALLLDGSPEFLSPRQLAGQTALPLPSASGSTVIDLPRGVVRVLEVRLSSWLRPARILTDPCSPLFVLQQHPFSRATSSAPMAFFWGGQLMLYPAAGAGDSLLSLFCVVYEDGVYEFDDSALADLHNLSNTL